MTDYTKFAEEALADEEGASAPAEGEGETDVAEAVAAEEVFDALKAADRKAFATSLKAYVDICLHKKE